MTEKHICSFEGVEDYPTEVWIVTENKDGSVTKTLDKGWDSVMKCKCGESVKFFNKKSTTHHSAEEI